jgi:predicted nucleic acid-binding protein
MRALLDVNVLIALLDVDHPPPVSLVAGRLAEATAQPVHEFWPDDISLLDERFVDREMIHDPRQLTDVYLLALATRRRGRLVTFEQATAVDAVRGAAARNMLRI